MTRIRNETKGSELAGDARWARWPWQRMRGLLGRRSLPEGQGLIFPRAGAIHTCFMRFDIDIVFLDEHGIVLKTARELSTFRFTGARGAHCCVELAAGTMHRTATEAGDRLTFSE